MKSVSNLILPLLILLPLVRSSSFLTDTPDPIDLDEFVIDLNEPAATRFKEPALRYKDLVHDYIKYKWLFPDLGADVYKAFDYYIWWYHKERHQ